MKLGLITHVGGALLALSLCAGGCADGSSQLDDSFDGRRSNKPPGAEPDPIDEPFMPPDDKTPSGPGGPECANDDLTGDLDGDGFSVADGDCNDCSPQMNPGALDYPDNDIDEDCNGPRDDEPVLCDGIVADLAVDDPVQAAQAIGLCRPALGDSWGLIDAAYTLADGTSGVDPRGHGLLATFGSVAPREGSRMLALSSGTARAPGDPQYVDPTSSWLGTQSEMPPGFPIPSPSCSTQIAELPTAYDPVALELTIKAPTNAKSVQFDFDFYTDEFPSFVCKQYNDFFVALMDPPPPDAQYGNISFDAFGNPVSVNNSLLDVCIPQTAGGKTFACSQGPAALQGTGFEGEGSSLDPSHAATGWLVTKAPVTPRETIKLRFAVWDSGDFVLASTVLIDNFRFDAEPAQSSTTDHVPR